MTGLLFFSVLIFLLFFLMYESIKVRNNYLKKSKLIEQKIEELKLKNELMEDKKTTTLEHSNDVNQIVDQVSDLLKLVIKKYLK